MREHLRVVARHLLEYAHVAVVHVVIPDVHHGCTEDWLFFILSHDQGRVWTLGRDGRERTRNTFGHFVMVYIPTHYNLHIIAVLMSIPEFSYHFTCNLIFYILLLPQNR